ncbi:cytosolic regulator pianissimo [Moniliophthora roreri MCA 2997]|uniref:Cytosolic regulator pianissimo n=2 Tax=Moniliophthora roreri TaxID=221103 RepID=V2YFJ2_MONRO|nr:cytosolic regulator pianissimo [Moniliophthora roreri MCA 2997]
MPSHLTTLSGTTLNASTSSVSSLPISLVNTSTDLIDAFDLESDLGGKDYNEQLEVLDARLVKENRIKEGAQNLLDMPLADKLRRQVQSELQAANSRIETIKNKRSDIQSALRGQHQQHRRREEPDEKGEDFRTVLHNAQAYIATLVSLKAGETSPSDSSTAESSKPDSKWIETMSKLGSVLQNNVRVRYELKVADVVQAVVPALADKRSIQCRAIAYRVIRHSLVDAESVRNLRKQNIDWYIIRTLHRDNKFAAEKEQVIKLIRTIVEVGTVRREMQNGDDCGIVPLSEPVMRALVAVAEHAEDPFRLICIQTLAELIVMDIDLVAKTGGIRFLLHAFGEGPIELAPILAFTFLHIAESPRSRAYLNVGIDLEITLSAITDAYGKGVDHADRMRSCVRVVLLMLRTWSGLMYFCMDDMRAIRSLVDTLRIPSLETRDIIINMFFDLFNIKSPEWYQTFITGRRLTMYRSRGGAKAEKNETEPSERNFQTLKLTDQYLALLLLVFTNADLLGALTSMIEESTTGTNLSRKATLLMGEILQMSNRILPLSVAARIQALPKIFQMASEYRENESRLVGTSVLSAIDSLNRNRTRLEPGLVKNYRLRSNSVDDAVRRGQRQVEQAKIKIGMQMDDKTFQNSLLETQVMFTKDHAKWNFDTIQELIEGPLLNTKRMDEAIKGARFIRRLMSFFHPFSRRFSDLHRNMVNSRWVRLGCSLLTTLLSSADGTRYLSSEDPFMGQIVKCFAQLDPFNGAPDADPIFSKRRIADTLTYGYLEMLGTLSKHKEGMEILEKYNIFTAFYHLSDLKSREDLIKGIVENLDYTIDGHPRIVLSKALTTSNKRIQVFATHHLGELIRRAPVASAWMLRLLLTQLYDPSAQVREVAVKYLEEACESKGVLELVVEMRPTMDHLGDIGNSLLLKFMSTPTGFRYLFDSGYIDREIDIWYSERNLYYVVQVEVFLAHVFSNSIPGEEEDHNNVLETVPPHFYGEMSKTELGCQVLQEKGHFADFAQFIRQHGHESGDPDLIMKLKSTLWAVGNIGATEGGLPFLEEEEIIPTVMDIANHSPIPTVRGTCFFMLGLISSTSQGCEILDDYHWEATLTPMGLPTGLCIPVDVDKFISLPPWKHHIPEQNDSQLIPPTAENELEVLTAIQNLANTVIANAASRSLARMKTRPEFKAVFSSPTMLYRALHTMSTSRYRLPVRRYIQDLFNIEWDESVVTAFIECAASLKAKASYRPPESDLNRRLSMFNRPRRASESDGEEDVEVDPGRPPVPVASERPAISLRPVSRIIGFTS